VRDYLEAAKANGLSTATLKQHMAAIRISGVDRYNDSTSLFKDSRSRSTQDS